MLWRERISRTVFDDNPLTNLIGGADLIAALRLRRRLAFPLWGDFGFLDTLKGALTFDLEFGETMKLGTLNSPTTYFSAFDQLRRGIVLDLSTNHLNSLPIHSFQDLQNWEIM